jgi:hypothetical protein
MITWGSTTLNVMYGTWSPYQSESTFIETILIPDSSNPNAINTVLQQSGRGRYRISATLIFSSITEYIALLAYKVGGTLQTLNDGTINAGYYIDTLQPPKYESDSCIKADIVFVEE